MRAYKLAMLGICVAVLWGAFPGQATAQKLRVAIFREPGFPAVGMPAGITPDWTGRVLDRSYRVTYLNSRQLADPAVFSPDRFDVLLLAYGEAFPRDAYDVIKKFLEQGGGVFHAAGRPFFRPQIFSGGTWRDEDDGDPSVRFMAPLGIKYYEDEQGLGLTVATTLRHSPVLPTRGNVFPYRIPVRDFYLPEEFSHQKSFSGSVLVRAWRNPYQEESRLPLRPWLLIAGTGAEHPLAPADRTAEELLIQAMRYLSAGLVLHAVETEFASYNPAEKVVMTARVSNTTTYAQRAELRVEIFTADETRVWKTRRTVRLAAGLSRRLTFRWPAPAGSNGYYRIRVTLRHASGITQHGENGFVVQAPTLRFDRPRITPRENQLALNGKTQFIWGTNYYESRQGELMWIRPNLNAVREDFQRMRRMGLRLVRIHYHHSKWFRDYYDEVLRQPLDAYLEAADMSALPSERSLRILDAIVYLSQESDLVLCVDLFTLVPQEMGDPIGWLGMRERIQEQERVNWQTRFLEVIGVRYREVAGVVWDLWNEPRLELEDMVTLRSWTERHIKTLRSAGSNHPVTIGDPLSISLLEVLDYGSLHTDKVSDIGWLGGYQRPVILGEVWNPAGATRAEEKRQRDRLVQDAKDAVASEAAGFLPWQWTRQARLWHHASEAERWDDELGLFMREDGTVKPAAKAFEKLYPSLRQSEEGAQP